MKNWFFPKRDIGPRPEPPAPLRGPFRLREIWLVTGEVFPVRDEDLIQLSPSRIDIANDVGVTAFYTHNIVKLRYW